MKIANGWRLYTADFSLNAKDPAVMGRVMYIRDEKNRKAWQELDMNEQDVVELFVSGYGHTIEGAIECANINAEREGNIVKE